MATRIAQETGRNDVVGGVSAPVLPGAEMFGSAPQPFGLPCGNAELLREEMCIAGAHELAAIEATTALAGEGSLTKTLKCGSRHGNSLGLQANPRDELLVWRAPTGIRLG